jgi:PIN domain nuclease of toxin-antitoxin system
MRHLIDTQILLWSLISPARLSESSRRVLANHEIFVSQISLLEIAIKQKINKLPEFALSIEELCARLDEDGFNLMPLRTEHISAYQAIPLFAEHRDPFDRILLATALSEGIPILSSDANFQLYRPAVQVLMNG